MERMNEYPDSELWHSFIGCWPALFRNKREHAAAQLETIANDPGADWLPRLSALECLMEAANVKGPGELDRMLARLATIAADRREDQHLRLMLGLNLLDYPRESHRALLEQLAGEQSHLPSPDLYFDSDDIADAYAEKEDTPEWEYEDFLAFYDPVAIRERQLAEAEEWDDLENDDLFTDPEDIQLPETYVRPTPRVGRNDPCPCGSGKKYKKCHGAG